MGPACCSRPVRAASHGSGDRFGEVYPPDGHDRSMSAIRKLKRALRAARNPRHWNALAHAVVPTIEHGTAFVGVEPAAVIDIGANKGQFCSFALARWPQAKLIAFEPPAGSAGLFRAIFGDSANRPTISLGQHAGEHDIPLAPPAASPSPSDSKTV